MARGVLTVNEISRTGLDSSGVYTAGDSVNGHLFTPNAGNTFVHVKNADASAHTCTITTPKQINGLAVADVAVSVPASDERMIGPFPPDLFNNSDGVYIDFDVATSVTLAVFKLPV